MLFKTKAKWQVPAMTWRGWLLVLLVCSFAFFVRFWKVGAIEETYFDEIYYAPAAEDYIEGRPDSNTVHPPLGKLQIAAGILAMRGLNDLIGTQYFTPSWERRFTSCVTGALFVLFTFLLVYRLARGRRDIALLAAFLVSIDFMAVVLSRICMLDMVNSLWITIGTYFCWRYIESCWNEEKRCHWAVLGAVSMAVATACKWNGLFATGGCWLAMVFLRDSKFAEAAGLYESGDSPEEQCPDEKEIAICNDSWGTIIKRTLQQNWPAAIKLASLFAFITALVYVLAYTPLFLRMGLGAEAWNEIWGFHVLMWEFRYDPEQFMHSYLSYFWEWPLVLRPIWLYFESSSSRLFVNGIVAFGSIVFWWPALLYMMESLHYGLSRRDAVRLFIVGLWAVQWLLWISSTTGGFIYYMLPVVPLMAAATAIAIGDWKAYATGKLVTVVFIALLTLAFALYWPFLSGDTTTMAFFNKLFPAWATRWR